MKDNASSPGAATPTMTLRSVSLPKECPRAALERCGFVFGAEVDNLLVYAEWPAGWRAEPTDSAGWFDLLDSDEHRRGLIYYNARNGIANLRLHTRYEVQTVGRLECTGSGEYITETFARVCDMGDRYPFGVELCRSRVVPSGPDCDPASEDEAAIHSEMSAWLDARYPDWRDPVAYWETGE